MENNLFANACDILRIYGVYKYGGIYSDFGWVMTPYIQIYLNNFDIMFNGEVVEHLKGYISHNVIYSKQKNHTIFVTMLSYFANKNFLIGKKIFEILEIVSPRFIMAIIPSLCNNNKLITLVNHEFTFSRHHNFSHQYGLFGSCKHKNVDNNVINEKIDNYINKL